MHGSNSFFVLVLLYEHVMFFNHAHQIIAVNMVLTGSLYYNRVRDKTDQNVYGHCHMIRFLIMLGDGGTFSIICAFSNALMEVGRNNSEDDVGCSEENESIMEIMPRRSHPLPYKIYLLSTQRALFQPCFFTMEEINGGRSARGSCHSAAIFTHMQSNRNDAFFLVARFHSHRRHMVLLT